MGRQVTLQHRTQYRYDRAVALGPQTIQLRPAPHCATPIASYELRITPSEHTLRWQFDPHGNAAARVVFAGRTTEFVVQVDLVADLAPRNPLDFRLDAGCETYPFTYPPDLARDLAPFLPQSADEAPGPLLRQFVESVRDGVLDGGQSTVGFLSGVNRRVCDATGYVTRLEFGVQTPEQTLALRTGSCRDSAWLLVKLFRQLGFAARFVSGYLIQLAVEHPPNAPEPDSAALHAWCEVFLPGASWVGMDATSGLFTTEGHIPLACTATPSQAGPIAGTVEPAEVDFRYTMTVQRLGELPSDPVAHDVQPAVSDLAPHIEAAPTVANPLSDDAWAQVRQLAHQVDRDLDTEDVRLTMGGEPTFVGIDDPESPQWHVEALGPEKRTRGLALIRSLRQRTAPGGLLHLGQGKWYPGEPLPRWAFHCISRVDGVPVWEDPELIAREEHQYGFGPHDALAFLQALARRLQVRADDILPAFNPDAELTGEAAGYILPLRRRQPEGRLTWSSQLWFLRPGRLILFPGDSPIGYRIPAEHIPFVAPDPLVYEYEVDHEHEDQDEQEDGTRAVAGPGSRIKLPAAPARRMDLFDTDPAPDPLPPKPENAETAPELIRPSLCVEVRQSRLHVFLPYVPVVADYLDLVAAVEDTCRHLHRPIWIEGYTPPIDPRLRAFSLTPDPGVLEVNLPPASNWDELETVNAVLHDEAARHRLRPEKFAFDGTHLATGGGSHIVLGGATVPCSPLLRRPDLLRSMLAFWQNHPSLSYLFSGMYVGPTSQYPRVDEARTDALYELEVAFSQLPAACPPHILDGLFRNLLVDVTGNAHRAEFCIDKLYPPEGLGLRAGLLELRAFEMAPHLRMGLLAMLLVRALVSSFWRTPFRGGLHRWGTALHDRFMLPHFVEADFAEVLHDLRISGYDFPDRWFAAQKEFRFPRIGHLAADGVQLELRQALEPWNVLAEETTSGRTGRSVDSSLERMQVKLRGIAAEDRYIVACNGRRVPLHPTGTPGESVAGIRYRARKLSAALHPTVPVHTPLTFDLIDTQTEHSVARCTYFAGPPTGGLYTTRPAAAAEASDRRHARFVVGTPPAGPFPVPPAEPNPIFPITLDLRWPAPASEPPNELSHMPTPEPQ